MIGQHADLSLSLLLLDPQLGSAVTIRTAAAEQDEDGPQQPEPCTQKTLNPPGRPGLTSALIGP